MGQYYYLGAQLPYLLYEQSPPISSMHFLELATEHMRASEAALLSLCTLDPDPDEGADAEKKAVNCGSLLIKRWKEWEMALRLNLARNRAIKLKRESVPEAPEFPAEAVLAAKSALTIESPLEAELFLDKARWDAIDALQGNNIFSDSAMYAYLLKLLLMEKRVKFNTDIGFREYKALYDAILTNTRTNTGEENDRN